MARIRLKDYPIMLEARVMMGRRVRALRHDSDESIKQVAKATGIPATNIAMAEQGRRYLLMPELIQLASKFNVSTDWIIKGGKLRRKLLSPTDHLLIPAEQRSQTSLTRI